MVKILIVAFSLLGVIYSHPTQELLSSGELVQALGRVLKPEDFQQFGIDVKDVSPLIQADAFLTVPQLLKKYGYPAEVHEVQTADGYLLEMHRIPKPGATPVLLMHGILDSSAGWVISGPHSALAYYLSDLGYDVWMGNVRGSRYSKKHTYLNPKRKAFWDFSFHEIGAMDIPAMVDYVIEKTEFKQIHYVAHSQGSTAFFVMCEHRPGYCDKIRSMNALAPVAYLRHVRSPLLIALSLIVDQLEFLGKLLGMHEFLPNNAIFQMAGQLLCKKEAITQPLCYNILFLITGYDSQELNKTMLPAILGHIPAGASTKQLVHYGQLVRTNHFRMFDYGLLKNRFRYGSWKPPAYDLGKTTAPVSLHYSMNDWLADNKDVQRLSDELPNVVGRYLVPLPKFNHMDFLFGISSRELVYKQVANIMKSYDDK